MKSCQGFGLIAIAVLAATIGIAGGAFAAGNFPWTKNKALIDNLNGIAPAKDDAGVMQSGCNTQTVTKGAIQGKYSSVEGYTGYSAEVVDSAGAAVSVKWELDGTQVKTGSSFEFINSGSNTYKRAVQRVYSAPARALTSCTRRQ